MGYTLLDDAPSSSGFTLLDDPKPTPMKTGREGFKDILKKELENANPFTRNFAGAGTALSNLYEGAKQFVGAGDQNRIEENKIIEQAAPVGAFLGNAALTAVPFAAVGNSLKAAGAVGAGFGALNPVEGEQTLGNIVQGKLQNAAIGGALGAGGQALANKAGNYFAGKIAQRFDESQARAPIDKTLQDAIDAGLVVPPSAVKPTLFNNLRDSIGGKALTSQEFSNKNAATIDALARKSVGLGENVPLTGDAMRSVRQAAFDRGYAPISNIGRVSTDDEYQAALSAIVEKYKGAAADFPGVASSSVTDFIEGKAKSGGAAARSVFVDSQGNIVPESMIPKPPVVRNLLDEIKKAGGLSVGEKGELGEAALNKINPGLLNKKTGKDADSVAEWMVQNGWISKADANFADRELTGGANELAKDLLRSAINREQVVHPRDFDKWSEFEGLMQQFGQEGIKRVDIPASAAEGGLRVAGFDAANGLKMIQLMRDEASAAFRQGDAALGKAKKEAAKALEDQIERSLAARGGDSADMLKNFRDARKLMAKAHTVEDAIVEGGGSINAKKLGSIAQNKPGRLSDELAVIGNFANNFPSAMQPAKKIQGPGVSALNLMASGGYGTAGGFIGGPAGAAIGMAYPFIARPLARQSAMSRGTQNALAQRMLGLSAPEASVNALARYLPVGGTVLGLEAFGQ
jgi:hypothetical protein